MVYMEVNVLIVLASYGDHVCKYLSLSCGRQRRFSIGGLA